MMDDRGDTLRLPRRPERIVSLVPAITEALVLMDAPSLLVGRTDYDTLSAVDGLPSVGGGLGPNLEVLRTLEPELVISFAGESDARTGPALAALGIGEFAVRPDGLDDIPRILRAVGELTGREAQADELLEEMEASMSAVRRAAAELPGLRGIYILGGSPPLVAGPGTFVSDLMALAGVENALSDLGELYATVSPEVLISREVDVVAMSEGTVVDDRILRGRRVVTVPNWVEVPGPRLGRAAIVVASALRPQLPDTLPDPAGRAR